MNIFGHKTRLLILIALLLISLLSLGSVFAQDPSPEEIIEAVMVFSNPQIYQHLDSPDGTLSVELTIYPCVEISGQETSYEYMDLINNDTYETQRIAEQLINCGGLGAFGLQALRWSNNGAYLYYTDAREGTPDGFVAVWTPPLWRVQIADFQIENLGQAQFSPDGTWIAAWEQEQIRLVAANSDESMSFELSPSELQMVELSWLPDNSGIIYIQADTLYGPASRSTVTHIDLTTLSQTVLLDTESK